MYLSALVAIERKGRKHVILASVAYPHAGGDASKVAAAYRSMVAGTKDGAEKRAKYSHVMFMVENQVRNTHAFPDPVVQEEKQKAVVANAAEHELELARKQIAAAGKQGQKALDTYREAVEKARAAGISVDEGELETLLRSAAPQRAPEPESKTEPPKQPEPPNQPEQTPSNDGGEGNGAGEASA
jgi:hypothetical protein